MTKKLIAAWNVILTIAAALSYLGWFLLFTHASQAISLQAWRGQNLEGAMFLLVATSFLTLFMSLLVFTPLILGEGKILGDILYRMQIVAIFSASVVFFVAVAFAPLALVRRLPDLVIKGLLGSAILWAIVTLALLAIGVRRQFRRRA